MKKCSKKFILGAIFLRKSASQRIKSPMKTISLLLILFFNQVTVASDTDWIRLSQDNLQQRLELQKSEMRTIDLRAYTSEKQTLLIYGVPKTAKALNPSGKIFRHYVGSGMEKILACNCLKAGFTPYIILNPGLGRQIFEDLYGIFLTTTEAKPEEVGLNANSDYDYIDFQLNPNTGVLWLESKIFVVPGNGDIPTWMKPQYAEYKRTGICEKTMCETFQRIDQRGGGLDPMFIPVEIKCIRQNKKVVCK